MPGFTLNLPEKSSRQKFCHAQQHPNILWYIYHVCFVSSRLKHLDIFRIALLSSHQIIKNGKHWLLIALVSSHHGLKNETNFTNWFFHYISLCIAPDKNSGDIIPANLHSGFGRLEDYRWLVGIFSPTACCHWSPGSHDVEQWKGFPPKRRIGSCLACVYHRYIVTILESTREATATISHEQLELLNLL